MLGQYVNNYEIIGLLGEGGMGAVYAAQHRLIGRKVAIKVLKRDLASEPEVVQRFFNEARAIGAIRHPNIIEIVDVGVLPGGVPYLVMELLEGESLCERMARLGPLPFDVAVDFVSQAARALELAHQRGVVHRDLKPENLFIVTAEAGREIVKVLDFGIAKLRDDLTATPVRTRAGSLLGTPLYMSPEQCRGLEELDLRTDVYSLGVILYEAVSGAPPFLAKSIGEVMRMQMFDAPEPPSRARSALPAHIERVILKCLAKHPGERFGSMLELQAALELSGLAKTEPDTAVSGQRNAPRGSKRQTGSLQLGLWAVVSSLVALVPDQRLPKRPVHAHAEASVLRLPAAVIMAMAPLRVAAAVVGTDEQRKVDAAIGSGARERVGQPGRVRAAAGQKLGSFKARPAPLPPSAASTASDEPARTASTEPGTLARESEGAEGVALQPGFLSLDSAPWAEVFLGDAALGTTPLIRVPLPPGRHQLTLRNTELDASTTYVVEIKSGQSLARLVGWGR